MFFFFNLRVKKHTVYLKPIMPQHPYEQLCKRYLWRRGVYYGRHLLKVHIKRLIKSFNSYHFQEDVSFVCYWKVMMECKRRGIDWTL